MGLSFRNELEKYQNLNLPGIELCQKLDILIEKNPAWQEEALQHLFMLLHYMEEIDASDIDFGAPGAQSKIWYRVYGRKMPFPQVDTYSEIETTFLILSYLSRTQKEFFYTHKNIDFSLNIAFEHGEKQSRFRGDVYLERRFTAVNFRRINPKIFELEYLGFPKPILDRMDLNYEKSGLILVTGITGSGKSTTLDVIIDMNNQRSQAHIIIIGHPIEYIHESKKALCRHREVGVDVPSFAQGAIDSLRQDPDIIVVGEMRDPKTIATVLEITDSGHKSFSTLHTSSAIDSIHRIVAEFPAEEQERVRNRLADLLSVIISQKLVPTRDGKRIMAKEILSVDASVSAAIRNKNIGEIYQMMSEGKKAGMITLEQDLLNLYKQGIVTAETAMGYANNKRRMMQLLSA